MKNEFVVIICALGMLSWTACKGPAQKGAPAMPPTPVNTVVVQEAPAIYYDKYPATVVALNSVELRAQVSGFITGIFFKEGQVVPKGKALYEIDRRKYQAAVRQAEANIMSAKANLNRAQKIWTATSAWQSRMLLPAKRWIMPPPRWKPTAASWPPQKPICWLPVQTWIICYQCAVHRPYWHIAGKAGCTGKPGHHAAEHYSSENPIGVDFVVNQTEISRFMNMQGRTVNPASDSTFRLQLPDGSFYKHAGKIIAIDRGVDPQTGTIKIRIEFEKPER